jgi:hypothetical protein
MLSEVLKTWTSESWSKKLHPRLLGPKFLECKERIIKFLYVICGTNNDSAVLTITP